VALGRNHGLAPLSMDLLQHTIAIIALVVDDVFCRQTFQESRGLRDVVCLARRQQKLYRVAGIVTGRVNLRSESAARPAEFPVPVFYAGVRRVNVSPHDRRAEQPSQIRVLRGVEDSLSNALLCPTIEPLKDTVRLAAPPRIARLSDKRHFTRSHCSSDDSNRRRISSSLRPIAHRRPTASPPLRRLECQHDLVCRSTARLLRSAPNRPALVSCGGFES